MKEAWTVVLWGIIVALLPFATNGEALTWAEVVMGIITLITGLWFVYRR